MRTIEARTSVLRALADGTITVAEAEERLAAMDDPVVGPPPAREPREGSGRGDARRGGRPSVDEVIALAAHGVDAAYLEALRTAGLGRLDVGDIIRLADHGVEAEWLAEVRRAGIDADVDDLVTMVDHGVEAEWLAQVPAAILRDLQVGDLVSLADNGVEPADLAAFLDLRRDDEEG